jgi:hypothetical protein
LLDWQTWAEEKCKELGFEISSNESPIIWDYTGKYIGNCNDFLELVRFCESMYIDPL